MARQSSVISVFR